MDIEIQEKNSGVDLLEQFEFTTKMIQNLLTLLRKYHTITRFVSIQTIILKRSTKI